MLHLVREAGLHDQFLIESAGTGGYHVGEEPDPRSASTARSRGVHLPSRAQRFRTSDFARFDYVLAMDGDNQRLLLALAPDAEAQKKVRLLRSFDPESPDGAGVPDPYYGHGDGFERVFDICMASCRALLAHLVAHGPARFDGQER
jgi:protein-tyrosine phosphatase